MRTTTSSLRRVIEQQHHYHQHSHHLAEAFITSSSHPAMFITKTALTLSLGCTARAFTPAARAFSPLTTTSRAFGSTTALNANVLKLTQPSKDLLSGVDVFIFDCDGVIWRVSAGWSRLCGYFGYDGFNASLPVVNGNKKMCISNQVLM